MVSLKLDKIIIHYDGLFDFDALYAAVIDWAKNYGFFWHEKTYKHKVPVPTGAEQELAWEMTKEVTEYIHHKINISIHIWDLTETEAEVGGKKKVLSNARVQLIINGTLTTNWQKRFEKGKLAKLLGKVHEKLTKKDLESIYWDQFYYRVLDLHAIIKKYFDMQTKKYAYKGYLGES